MTLQGSRWRVQVWNAEKLVSESQVYARPAGPRETYRTARSLARQSLYLFGRSLGFSVRLMPVSFDSFDWVEVWSPEGWRGGRFAQVTYVRLGPLEHGCESCCPVLAPGSVSTAPIMLGSSSPRSG